MGMKAIVILSILCGLFVTQSNAYDKNAIEKDTVEMLEKSLNDDITRSKILKHYKSTCTWEEKRLYWNCLREAAAVWNLTSGSTQISLKVCQYK